MKFVVIEGLDGSGKSTQIRLLREYLDTKKIQFKYLHFPRTDSPVYGELIARFLRGESGDIHSVDPYLIALLYAGDRNDAKSLLTKWKHDGNFILVDRYVISNIAFQCAKFDSEREQMKLMDWIINLEYDYNCLPVPDINIFLDVPFEFTKKQLMKDRLGDDRKYLNGRVDIHEANLDFQKRVREVYLSLIEKIDNYIILNCIGNDKNIMDPEKIFKKIIAQIGV